MNGIFPLLIKVPWRIARIRQSTVYMQVIISDPPRTNEREVVQGIIDM